MQIVPIDFCLFVEISKGIGKTFSSKNQAQSFILFLYHGWLLMYFSVRNSSISAVIPKASNRQSHLTASIRCPAKRCYPSLLTHCIPSPLSLHPSPSYENPTLYLRWLPNSCASSKQASKDGRCYPVFFYSHMWEVSWNRESFALCARGGGDAIELIFLVLLWNFYGKMESCLRQNSWPWSFWEKQLFLSALSFTLLQERKTGCMILRMQVAWEDLSSYEYFDSFFDDQFINQSKTYFFRTCSMSEIVNHANGFIQDQLFFQALMHFIKEFRI